MNRSMVEMKKAVRAGYWNLLRFDPRLAEEGKNPLQIDSAKPNEDYQSFLRGEVRYASLRMKNPSTRMPSSQSPRRMHWAVMRV